VLNQFLCKYALTVKFVHFFQLEMA